jgi:hypothetical protein
MSLMKLPAKWPELIEVKNVTVKIYRHNNKGYTEFKVAYYDTDGRRRFYTFADYQVAKSKAKDVAATINRGEAKTLTLSGAHCVHYLRAMDALCPFSVPLDIAATEYADAKQRLGEHSLKDAVTFFLKVQVGTVEKPVADIVAEFIETKSVRTASGRPASVDYLRDIRNRLGRFSETFTAICRRLDRLKSELSWMD